MTAPLKPQIKQPAEALSLPFAFAELSIGAVVASATVTIAARGIVPEVAPLVSASHAIAGDTVRVALAGGTDGETYLVTVDATDDAGDTFEAEAEVRVIDLAYAVPDGATPYVSIAQFVDRFGVEQTIRNTDTLRTGRIDKARLTDALTDAQSVADGYIAAAGFGVPLPIVPPIVTTIVLDLANARLYGAALPEGVATAKADAMAMLKDIAAGRLKLPLAAVTAAIPVSPTPIFTSGPDRVFSRTTLCSF